MKTSDNSFPRQEEGAKLPSLEELLENIPEMKAMKGFDQRSDFHDLPLDAHTREVAKHLLADESVNHHPKKELLLLAAHLHDLGKMSPEGTQIHPKDPEKRQYFGHESVSEKIAREILERSESGPILKEEDKEIVCGLIGLHASALNVMNNFKKNREPKGGELGSYDGFLAKVESIPGGLSVEEKMDLVLALNRADVLATFDENSDRSSEKISKIVARAEESAAALDELKKALPAIIEAVRARGAGAQEAAVVFRDGRYQFVDLKAEKKKEPALLDEAAVTVIGRNLETLGVDGKRAEEFMGILRGQGIPGLGRAGFGKQAGMIRKILNPLK